MIRQVVHYNNESDLQEAKKYLLEWGKEKDLTLVEYKEPKEIYNTMNNSIVYALTARFEKTIKTNQNDTRRTA
jgi:hypothetical protein